MVIRIILKALHISGLDSNGISSFGFTAIGLLSRHRWLTESEFYPIELVNNFAFKKPDLTAM